MSTKRKLEQDLEYVREVADRAESGGSPAAIYYLWAVLVAVGFTLADFAPGVLGTYWLAAGTGGFLLSMLIGWRYSRHTGQLSRRDGMRHTLHWLGMSVAIALSVLLVLTGSLEPSGLGRVILLLVALGYFTAGLHLDRPLRWVGLVLAAGYLVVLFLPGPVWTIVGAFIALALVASGLRVQRGARAHAR